MLLTVAICTWNRSVLLRQTLEQFTRVDAAQGFEWELIVVDNNSTDDTAAVLTEFASRLPLVALHEPRPGKSNAANLAVREARGDYILWTDDDVLVAPDWMQEYFAAFNRFPDADVFGGRIDPWFEGTPPEWLARGFRQIAGVYAAMDLELPDGPAPENFFPFGANMAIKRSAHLRHTFNTRIGPQPGSSIRGEEWMLVREMRRSGSRVVWVPDAKVQHFIPSHRQTMAYIRDWFYGNGELLARLESDPGLGHWFGRPVWLWREWIEYTLRGALGRFISPPERWLRNVGVGATAWGRLRNYERKASLP